jgi:flagellar protein FliS
VRSASPHQLILMLFEGALLSIAIAEQKMKEGRMNEKGLAISRAIDIIGQGLQASLDMQVGELAANLSALYEYMIQRLVFANQHNQPKVLQEVAGLLRELKGAWEEIANDPAALSANRAAA